MPKGEPRTRRPRGQAPCPALRKFGSNTAPQMWTQLRCTSHDLNGRWKVQAGHWWLHPIYHKNHDQSASYVYHWWIPGDHASKFETLFLTSRLPLRHFEHGQILTTHLICTSSLHRTTGPPGLAQCPCRSAPRWERGNRRGPRFSKHRQTLTIRFTSKVKYQCRKIIFEKCKTYVRLSLCYKKKGRTK